MCVSIHVNKPYVANSKLR